MSERRGDSALDVHAYELRLQRDAARAAALLRRWTGTETERSGVVTASGLHALMSTSGRPCTDADSSGCVE